MRYVAAYVGALLCFVAVDLAWLSTIGQKLFISQVGQLLRPEPELKAAAVFYLIYAGGLVALAIVPALHESSLRSAVWRGAVLGLTAYATFDLTNLSVVKGWTPLIAGIDLTWGTVVSAVAAAAGYGAGSFVSRSWT